ncbi:uncharacterized protein LOC144157857 [Haemaphysalis longicornis]
MPTCCVPGCTSGYRGNKTPRHFFSPPSDPGLRAAWDRAIPRLDRSLSTKSRVCDVHFYPDDIAKTYTHFIKGEKVETERGKWSLVEGAVPKIFPNLPPYLSKPPPKRRKLPCRDQVVAQTSSAKKAKTSASAVAEESAANLDMPAASSKPTLREMEEVCLPSTNWRKIVDSDDDGSYVAFFVQKVEGKMLFVEKCVIIGELGAVTVSTRGCIVKSCSRVNTIAQLVGLLQNVDQLRVCVGSSNGSAGSALNEGRSTKCERLTKSQRCGPCLKLKLELRKKLCQERLRRKQQKQKLNIFQKRAVRAAVRRTRLLSKIQELKTKLTSNPDDSLREAINVLPPIQQEAFRSSFKQAKVKGPQGMRYSTTWVMNCLLLRIASPKAYKLIKAMNLLPLPTCSRLNQIIAGVPCQYGFNKVALETIKTYFKNNPEKWNHGTILIDEIKLRQSVEFNPSTYKFDGFVDFAGTAPDENGKLADHALVVMFVPIFDSWVQPVASFATRGAAPGVVLAKMVLESVLQLERHGASILAVVSDGAGNNRSMWTHLGISGKLDQATNKVPHPSLEEGRFLHFLCDVPHIMKCIRNHLLTHTYGMVSTIFLQKYQD